MSSREIAKRILSGETIHREDIDYPLNVLFQLQDLIKTNKFNVSFAKMVASNKTTFIVTIDHPDRPKDAKPWDSGRMQVFETPIEKHAYLEMERWKCFFANKEYDYDI